MIYRFTMLLLSSILFILLAVCDCSHFRGGTISWKPTGNSLEVEFTYKLGWTYGDGAGCTNALSGQYVSRQTFLWSCTSGCGTSRAISNAGYICSSASIVHRWEQGEYTFTYKFPNAGPFIIQYIGCCWISLDYGSGGSSSWTIATEVDLRLRSDLGRPNASPVYTGYPIYRIKYECKSTIRLQVSDADNDNIHCRWASGTECNSVCNALPNAVLNQDCTITFDASHKPGGIYAVAVIIEDRPKSTITVGGTIYTSNDVLSSVPVQFLVETPNITSKQCSDRPVFILPTPSGTIDINVTPGSQLDLEFYVQSINASITSVALAGPTGINKSPIRSVVGKTDVYQVTVTWTPSRAQTGRNTLCADAIDIYGLNTDPHCIQINVLDMDPCDSDPCKNCGTCKRIGTTDTVTCSCLSGYTGLLCETELNECVSNPCQNGGICTDIVDGFYCTCSPGYEGVLCQNEINDCQSSPCMNNGTCSDHVNSFQCACKRGFTGYTCQIETDECISRPCINNGTCIDAVNRYRCVCSLGFTGSNCEIDIDECQSTPCLNNGTCHDVVNSYMCECQHGYTGTVCHIDINECQSSPCMNNGTCSDHVNSYQCKCKPGFTGSTCQIDINECQSSPCMNNGTCSDHVNSFQCKCKPGFTGSTCQIDTDECIGSPCMNNGSCIDAVNRYRCVCSLGFTGSNCEIDIDECQSTPCLNNGTCHDVVNSYMCECQSGYAGTVCHIDIDECQSIPCLNNGTCHDVINSYLCECQHGYTGAVCHIDINECQSSPCMNNGTCSDHVNRYQCACQPGFTGITCQVDIDECISRPCFNNGTCVDDVNGYSCVCSPGFTGSYCEIDTDECKSAPCFNNGKCHDMVNSYLCECQPGYTGDVCHMEIDECQSNSCLHNGTCFDLINSFFCGCEKGYSGNRCEIDVDDCMDRPCLNGGNCTDILASFKCSCPPAFTGEICQVGIDPCSSMPCKNNGECLSHNSTYFTCSCMDSWEGMNCAYRHQNESFVNSSFMTSRHMRYSECDCFLGNSQKQLCYKYKKGNSIGYGALGMLLGILTVVGLYVLSEVCLRKEFPSNAKTTKPRQQIENKNDLHTKDDLGLDDVAVKEIQFGQDKTDTKKVKTHIHGHKHRKCWACEVKYNGALPPRFW